MHPYLQAYERHRAAAAEALRLFEEYCGRKSWRVPGMSTDIRLAWRIECGATVEQAAAREYVYRWSLAIRPGDQVVGAPCRDAAVSGFGTPHTIGM